MNENAIRWFEIYVQDIARAKAFYEAVFKCKLEKIPGPDLEMWAFPGGQDRPGANGTIVQMAGVSSGGNSTLVYFGCEDCAIEEARVEPAGGKIHRPKLSIGPYGFVSLLFDTEGNLFGLHSMK